MGLDKGFVEKAFSRGEDRVNRAIFVKPEELIEIPDGEISFLGEALFYFLPRSKFVKDNKDKIRKEYKLSDKIPKINGVYLPTFLKTRAWDRIRKTKPSLKDLMAMFDK